MTARRVSLSRNEKQRRLYYQRLRDSIWRKTVNTDESKQNVLYLEVRTWNKSGYQVDSENIGSSRIREQHLWKRKRAKAFEFMHFGCSHRIASHRSSGQTSSRVRMRIRRITTPHRADAIAFAFPAKSLRYDFRLPEYSESNLPLLQHGFFFL